MRNIFILFLFLPLLSYCQTERDLVSILIYNTKFDGVTDQDFKNDIEQDFKDLITDRIKICPKHLTRRSSRVNEAYLILEDNKQLRENLFKKYNFTEDSLPIPFGTDAIIFSSFENQGGVAYMNMGIYAGGREVNHDRLRNKKFLVEDIKGDGKREEFLNTLIEAVLNPNTISELVSSVLGIKENDVNCFGEVITGVVNVSYHEKITQEKLVSPSHIIMNNSSISTSKINWITQRSYLGLFNSRKNGSIDSSEKSIGFSFKRAGKYSIRLIAEGTRKSDTLDIRTIQLAPRKPKTYQSVALGAGLASLSVSLFIWNPKIFMRDIK